MKIELNTWLQDAIILFLENWVADRVKEQNFDAKHVTVLAASTDTDELVFEWSFYPMGIHDRYTKKEGRMTFTPSYALSLFMQRGPKS